MRQIIPAVIFILCSFSTQAQVISDNPLTTKVDSLVQSALSDFMQNNARVNVEAGVFANGQQYTYRYSNKALPAPNTRYEIGSITKTFTGYLLAKAVIEKRVKLDDDIRFYLNGDYPNLEYKGHGIQMKHLISHVSGLPFMLPEHNDLFQQPQDSIPFIVVRSQENYGTAAFLNDLHQVKLDTIPGYKFKYSNTGAQLLGIMLERIYGISYDQLVRKYITRPQHMKYTTTETPSNKKDVAKGYNGNGIVMPYIPPFTLAAGGVYSSVPDMLQYIRLHLDENNRAVLLTHQPAWGDFSSFAVGLNWQMNKTMKGARRIWQSGGTFGFSSYCVIYPDLNVGIVLLSNEADQTAQEGLGAAAGKIFEGLQ